MVETLVVATVLMGGALGLAIVSLWRALRYAKTLHAQLQEDEIAPQKTHRECEVLARLFESHGITFNRDDDGYIIGLVHDFNVELEGTGSYG